MDPEINRYAFIYILLPIDLFGMERERSLSDLNRKPRLYKKGLAVLNPNP